jgi:antitoxin Phd
MTWQLNVAKQRFSELVERAQREGPQLVTKYGRDVVVVVSVDEYQRLKRPRDNLVEFLQSAPDFDLLDLRRAVDGGREPAL